jgi:ATP phosphoribosyltransferase regulatory subunit HisZ
MTNMLRDACTHGFENNIDDLAEHGLDVRRPVEDAAFGPSGETRGREKDMMGEKEGREEGKKKEG